MGWLRGAGAVVAAAVVMACVAAAGARAADVSFACCSYAPASVRIVPGASVTWSGDFSQHPLHARDGESESFGPIGAGSTFSHVYPAAGVFHYFCTIHGASQTSGMIGTVVVTSNQPPIAALNGPASAPAGTSVTWDASGSSDPDGVVARYEWDLDGNGSFETDTGFMPTASHTYASPGSVTVRVRVTDDNADAVGPESDVASRVLTVTAAAPGAGTPGGGGSGTGGPGTGGGTDPATTPAGPAPSGTGTTGGATDGGLGSPVTGPAPALGLAAPARVRLGALRAHGLTVHVRAARDGTARGTLLVAGRLVAAGSARVRAGRPATLRVRLTAAGRRRLAHPRRAARATLRVQIAGAGAPVTRTVLLLR